ncbi:hypothetical protein BT96DRAFT_801511, partial [Gymnopus androsaceus JB14]
ASRIASDLWYEQARGLINTLLRKQAKLEVVRALVLLALRDYGKGGVGGGGESQAWLLVGMAIRLGQELDLPASAAASFEPHPRGTSTTKTRCTHTPEEHRARGNTWAIATMLDAFLSLQLGRTPGVVDVLKPKPKSSPAHDPTLPPTPTPTLNLVNGLLFAYTYSLSKIVSKINFWFYLG